MITLYDHDSGDEDIVCWLDRLHHRVRSAIPDCPPDQAVVYRVEGTVLWFEPDGRIFFQEVP